MPSPFALQRSEETFHRRVVVAIPFATHPRHDTAVREELLIESRAVLIALIAMMHQPRGSTMRMTAT